MSERKTLLKRYEIPLDHLDFAYINKCNDPKEMERIVHVLQSGEEGYFPDLTKCAEDKLRLLKPHSRLFRCEEQALRCQDVEAKDVKPIYDFSEKVRVREEKLTGCKETLDDLPAMRAPGTIKLNAKDKKNASGGGGGDSAEHKSASDGAGVGKVAGGTNTKRISSTDYRKWDEYDPDVEILRMDLEEERAQEEVERKNRLNANKSQTTPLITEIKDEEERLRKLSEVERETLAEEHRLRGNDYYRSKDFKEALMEYTRAIDINPKKAAAAYNNRALINIKMKNFKEAMHDSEQCLLIEPNNVKAMYRLAESSLQCGFKEKAWELFNKVDTLEPNNVNAKNYIEYLRPQICEKPPATATRLQIVEAPSSATKPKTTAANTSEVKAKTQTLEKPKQTAKPKAQKKETVKDYDLSTLIRPKEIVPNKIVDTAANMFKQGLPAPLAAGEQKSLKQNQMTPKPQELADDTFALRLPTSVDQNSKVKRDKPLIQEI